jgi:hypothetical protein
MDLLRERLTRVARQIFGSGATITGSLGNPRHEGRLTITVDGQPMGSGKTLEQALQVATRRASQAVGTGRV